MSTSNQSFRKIVTTKGGNLLSFFYNPQSNLLVVDLVDKDETCRNEIICRTLNEEKMLSHKKVKT